MVTTVSLPFLSNRRFRNARVDCNAVQPGTWVTLFRLPEKEDRAGGSCGKPVCRFPKERWARSWRPRLRQLPRAFSDLWSRDAKKRLRRRLELCGAPYKWGNAERPVMRSGSGKDL